MRRSLAGHMRQRVEVNSRVRGLTICLLGAVVAAASCIPIPEAWTAVIVDNRTERTFLLGFRPTGVGEPKDWSGWLVTPRSLARAFSVMGAPEGRVVLYSEQCEKLEDIPMRSEGVFRITIHDNPRRVSVATETELDRVSASLREIRVDGNCLVPATPTGPR